MWKLSQYWRLQLNTNGLNNYYYSKLSGQMRGYQYHSPDGFQQVLWFNASFDDNYVCGYSITCMTPRQHIWTYAGGIHQYSLYVYDCPCNTDFTHKAITSQYLTLVMITIVNQDSPLPMALVQCSILLIHCGMVSSVLDKKVVVVLILTCLGFINI